MRTEPGGSGREDALLFSFPPIYDRSSRILILGTMPSPASLRAGMYYSHPRNAFWRLMGDLTGDDPGRSNAEKKAFLLRRHIALWDTLESCVRPSSADSDIAAAAPNDIPHLLAGAPRIGAVFLNGGAALAFYRRYQRSVGLPFFGLPSTSPANARMSYEEKLRAWEIVRAHLQ
jgi:hypoxanthine-DNA glycosylase